VTKQGVVPTWWLDAKVGIFIHWTPASVAGFAPTDVEIGDLLASGRRHPIAEMPYTEWYENSLRFPGSSVAAYHRRTYGRRPYRDFAGQFEAALSGWDPDEWARAFRAAGAKYVVLVTKHHDGYCLWPTNVVNPQQRNWHTRRDVVGELAEAVRAQGLRFGVYYSGGLDWTFNATPIGSMSDVLAAIPRGTYPAYADAQVRELITRYRPSILWNDIAWPSTMPSLDNLLDDYRAEIPDGLINDRWMPWRHLLRLATTSPAKRAVDGLARRTARRQRGLIPPKPPRYDVRTPEYTTFDRIQVEPWECVRGVDRSFGYNRASSEKLHLSRTELVSSLTDIVAKGGNLLLNVGPRGEDAQIPERQRRRLEWLGSWLDQTGPAMYATRPWVRPDGRVPEGADVRFTARGSTVWALVLGPLAGTVTFPDVLSTASTTVITATGAPLRWSQGTGGLTVELPEPPTADGQAVALGDVTAGPG
jgi:alpha-L-fucosidase